MNDTNELELFKTQINLADFIAADGYTIDRKGTSRRHTELRAGCDVLIVSCDPNDGHWRYFNRCDGSDRGTIIDYVQSRQSLNLGEVRKLLREYTGTNPPPKSPHTAPNSFDRTAVRHYLKESVRIVSYHPYLLRRGIPADIQQRYSKSIGMTDDRFRNAVFPHRDDIGLCGAELKNRNYTGFIAHSKRGLWLARSVDSTAVAVAETAIDALSYSAAHPGLQLDLVSLCGIVSPDQISWLRQIVGDRDLHICTDADQAGDMCAERLADAFPSSLRCRPSSKDWNASL